MSALEGFIGRIEVAPDGGWRIGGWAREPAAPDAPVALRVLCNGVEIGAATAQAFRADLVVPGRAEGRNAFLVEFPDTSGFPPPVTASSFDVLCAESGFPLPRATQLLAGADPDGAPRGAIDIATRERIAGWLRDDHQQDVPLTVVICANGAQVARVTANRLRPDLRDSGLGSGRHGFDITLTHPLPALSDQIVTLTCVETGQTLRGSPIRFPAAKRFNDALRQDIAQLLSGLNTAEKRQDALDFLMEQAESLRQNQAREDAQIQAREMRRALIRQGEEAGGALRKRVLFIDGHAPDPTRDAGSNALLSHMRACLDLGHEVSFMAADQPSGPSAIRMLAGLGIQGWHAPAYPTVEALLSLQAGTFDAIYLHRLSSAARYLPLARHYCPQARVVWSVADLAHLRLARQAEIEARPELGLAAAQERTREHMAAWSAHAVITHSPEEARLLRQAVPTARIHVVPWAIPEGPPALPFPERSGIAMIAHYGHAPNLDAAKFLVADILPRLRETIPEASLLLVGSAMPDAVYQMGRQDGVQVLGHVADLSGFLRGVRLTIAPLRYGAGIKGKVLESWAAGIACIMTGMAAEGLDLPETLQECVAEDAAGLAMLALDLYADAARAERLARAGREFIRHRYEAALVREGLLAAIGI